MITISTQNPKALLITIVQSGENQIQTQARLEELASLAQTMEVQVLLSLTIVLNQKHPATLIGSGKVEELKSLIDLHSADLIIFDQELPPRAQRNLENRLDCAVIDRQEVILQIFSDRAATKEARLQVALARQQYSLPRLTRRWTHLSRQRGGMRGTRDAGETQLELDRRIVLNTISSLKKELKKVVSQRSVQRKSRLNSPIATCAIVGYTNAGKSSLLNALSNSSVLVENKLFATLDPTTRTITLPLGKQMLLSDTVGFVSNLPHQLVEAFTSTLEEATYADCILHVIDASHPDPLGCFATTTQVLHSLGCSEKPTILFINKMDALSDEFAIARLKSEHPKALEGSVKQRVGIDTLLQALEEAATYGMVLKKYLLPLDRGDLLERLRNQGALLYSEYIDEGITVQAKVPSHLIDELAKFEQL
ncbi:MAG: GTPase HflX [Sphaerochaetaceae bacterium]